jgi:zinc protease
MRKIILSGLFIVGALTANSQRKIEFVEYDLPNGIHVILHQERSTPIVAVSVLYHVGSKNESTERTGFAHFFEHLLFEGSANIGRGEYSELVEKNGGSIRVESQIGKGTKFYITILSS